MWSTWIITFVIFLAIFGLSIFGCIEGEANHGSRYIYIAISVIAFAAIGTSIYYHSAMEEKEGKVAVKVESRLDSY